MCQGESDYPKSACKLLTHYSLRERFIFLAAEAFVQAGAFRRSRQRGEALTSNSSFFTTLLRLGPLACTPWRSEGVSFITSIPLRSPDPPTDT
jgi:hypothetical protein